MNFLFLTVSLSILKKMDLNYPFRSYPIKSSNIITPFINDVYIKNVKRLYNEIDSLCNSINENDLVLLLDLL